MQQRPVLVLNADWKPLSFLPLETWSWQDAVKDLFSGKVRMAARYEETVRSPSLEIPLPSVVALTEYRTREREPAFTRRAVFLRDRFTCQYCGRRMRSEQLTFDHVVPRSKGGRADWENILAACGDCNSRKSNLTLEQAGMRYLRAPRKPRLSELEEAVRETLRGRVHPTWGEFLGMGPDETAAPGDALAGADRGGFPPTDGKAFPAGMDDRTYWEVPLEP